MKIKFVVDVGEYLEGQEIELEDELAEQFLEANSAVKAVKKESKPKKKDKKDDKDL